MTQVLVLDNTRELKDDIELQCIVEDYNDDFQVTTLMPSQIQNMRTAVSAKPYGFALVAYKDVDGVNPSDFGNVGLYGYTTENEKPDLFDQKGIGYMGNAKNGSDLLHIIYDIMVGKTPEVKKAAVSAVEEAENVPAQAAEAPRKEKSIQDLIDGDDDEVVPSDKVNGAPKPPVITPAPEAKHEPRPSVVQETVKKTAAAQDSAEDDRVTRGAKLRQSQMKRAQDQYQEDLQGTKENKTTTVAVFSAKGGVGKTTLSTNIAMYLSLMAHGRGNYRVCIVDYNIDFGDVRSTLGFAEDGVDMTTWAEDIHRQVVRGRRLEDINFTKEQIESYLQRNSGSGLYALVAPLLHEEAMALDADELQVMLRNIIQYGEFDFVICDTGNNTRDSTYFALDMADVVLLVCTQDATTVTCNGSALTALKRLDFDLSKVRIIVNNVVSAKMTGVSAAEVEEAFGEYECIARIRRNDDVLRANNYSNPLVLRPNHPFTAELRKIITYLTNEENLDADHDKKRGGFLAKLFK